MRHWFTTFMGVTFLQELLTVSNLVHTVPGTSTVPGTYGTIPGMYGTIPGAHGTVLGKYGTMVQYFRSYLVQVHQVFSCILAVDATLVHKYAPEAY